MSAEAKILKGTIVRGEQLKLPRTKSLYASAAVHPLVRITSCKIKSDGSEIIELVLSRLEIPEEPVSAINTEEPVAIVCHKDDLYLPEVYATRNDFPLGLPHSNARPYSYPVSMCVSDVSFADMRMQFNAYDFIQSIRRWFELNSINQLHESDRPLEVFFVPDEVCAMLNEPDASKPYLKYQHITDRTSTFEFVEKNEASHYLITLQTDDLISRNFAQLPRILSDLSSILTNNNIPVPNALLKAILSTPNTILKIKLLLMVKEKRNESSNTEYTGMFLITLPFSISEVKHRAKILGNDSFVEWFNSIPIQVAFLMHPIVRELNAIYNGTEKQYGKVCLVGVGTLGSIVADHFARMGTCEEIVMIDNDYFSPHNFARHTLPFQSLMRLKVDGLKKQYIGVSGQKIRTIQANVCSLTKGQIAMAFDDCDLIVDMSTSIAVERMLALDSTYEKVRKCTAFLNPKGVDLVLLMEDKERNDRLDLLEMSYYRELITNNKLSGHLNVAELRKTNQFSCRSESAVINYDNVGILASLASQQIKLRSVVNDSSIGIWHVKDNSGEVEFIKILAEKWDSFEYGGCSVLVCGSVTSEVRKYAEIANRCETGGCIFGCYDKDRRLIYILYATSAPEDSIATSTSFLRGTVGLKELCEKVNERTFFQVRYLGEWHSHTKSSNRPSGIDDNQFKDMSKTHGEQDIPFVQMIYGTNGLFVRCKM